MTESTVSSTPASAQTEGEVKPDGASKKPQHRGQRSVSPPKAANAAAKSTSPKGTNRRTKSAAGSTPRSGKKKGVSAVRQDSKKAAILEMLRRSGGATLGEIMKATKWQAHSVRGFISGNVTKKMSLAVRSTRREDGERVYQIAK
jgi:hypothetical protein